MDQVELVHIRTFWKPISNEKFLLIVSVREVQSWEETTTAVSTSNVVLGLSVEMEFGGRASAPLGYEQGFRRRQGTLCRP